MSERRDPPPVSTAAADHVAAIWERAHRWLDINAPNARDWLAPPVSPDAVERAERVLGVTLPDDLRASLAIHDGQISYTAPLFAGLRLLPLEEVVRDWRIDEQVAATVGAITARSLPDGVVRPVWVSRGWIPIGRDDGGNAAVVDLDPGAAGTRGQVVYYFLKHPDRPRVATSFAEFLADRVADWERGVEVPDREEDGHFVGFVHARRAWPGR